MSLVTRATRSRVGSFHEHSSTSTPRLLPKRIRCSRSGTEASMSLMLKMLRVEPVCMATLSASSARSLELQSHHRPRDLHVRDLPTGKKYLRPLHSQKSTQLALPEQAPLGHFARRQQTTVSFPVRRCRR